MTADKAKELMGLVDALADAHLAHLCRKAYINAAPAEEAVYLFARAAVEAALSAEVAPESWQLVPIEPTYEMCIAEWDVSLSDAHTITGVSECAWAAMLKAAPPPPASQTKEPTP